MAGTPVQIVRYPNRRFYAREESGGSTGGYLSLPQIEQLVCAGKDVQVRDSQTNEDLTRTVLTRLLLERQPEKMRLFPVALLHFMLRSNDVMAGFLRDYFRHSLTYLEFLQRHGAASLSLSQPIHWVKAWLDNIGTRPEESEASDAERLHRRVAELEARIRQLEGDRAAGS